MKTIELDCPNGHGRLEEAQVEEILRGGSNVAILALRALVCRRCGTRLFSIADVRRMEAIRGSLSAGDFTGMQPVGNFFKAE